MDGQSSAAAQKSTVASVSPLANRSWLGPTWVHTDESLAKGRHLDASRRRGHVLFADSKERSVQIGVGNPGLYPVPARVKYKGKTVIGTVSARTIAGFGLVFTFVPRDINHELSFLV